MSISDFELEKKDDRNIFQKGFDLSEKSLNASSEWFYRNFTDMTLKTGKALGLTDKDRLDDTPLNRDILGDKYFETGTNGEEYDSIFQDVAQGVTRNVVGTAKKFAVDPIWERVTGQSAALDDSPLNRALMGDEYFDDYSQDIVNEMAEIGDLGAGLILPEALEGGYTQKFTAGLLGGTIWASDFLGGGQVKGFVKNLVKETSEKKVRDTLLKETSLNKEFIDAITPHIAKSTDETQVKAIIDSFETSRFGKNLPSPDDAVPAAGRIADDVNFNPIEATLGAQARAASKQLDEGGLVENLDETVKLLEDYDVKLQNNYDLLRKHIDSITDPVERRILQEEVLSNIDTVKNITEKQGGKELLDELRATGGQLISRQKIDEIFEGNLKVPLTRSELAGIEVATTKSTQNLNRFSRFLNGEQDLISSESLDALRAKLTRSGEEGIDLLDDAEVVQRAARSESLWLQRLAAVRTQASSEAGSSLQSFNKFLTNSEKLIGKLDKALEKVRNSNPRLYAQVSETLSEIHLMPEGYDKSKAIAELSRRVEGPDWADAVAEWMTAIKLTSPKTQLTNFFGNAGRLTVDVLAQSIISILSMKPKRLVADIKGTMSGLAKGRREMWKALKDEDYARLRPENSSKIEQDFAIGRRGIDGDNKVLGGFTRSKNGDLNIAGKAANGVGSAVRVPFRLLSAMDLLFRDIAYERVLHRSAAEAKMSYEEYVKNIPEDVLKYASKEADRMTFQEELGSFMTQLNALRDPSVAAGNFDKSVRVGIRAFLPFFKTPTNLVKQGVGDFTPVGLFKNFDAKDWKNFAKGDFSTFTPRKQIAAVEAVMGSVIMGLAYSATQNGNMTGNAPKDSAERDQFYREHPANSIKVGNTWYSYNKADPLGYVLAMAANTAQGEDGFSPTNMMSSIGQVLFDKSYMTGLKDMMTVMDPDSESWERNRAISNFIVGNSVPAFIQTVSRAEGEIRDTRGEDFAETLANQYASVIPGQQDTLASRVDVFGNTVERSNQGLAYMFNPVDNKQMYIDPVTKWLSNEDLTIPLPSRTIYVNGEYKKLSNAEYEAYSRTTGKMIYQEMIERIQSGKFDNMDEEDKVAEIKSIRSAVSKDVRKNMFNNKPKSRSNSSGFGGIGGGDFGGIGGSNFGGI